MLSIFKNEADQATYYDYYDDTLTLFGLPYESRYIETSFGQTHVLVFGDQSKPPLVLLHGMTVSSTMWYPNMKALITERVVYTVDVLGDFGKSKVKDIIKTKQAASNWLSEVFVGLGLDKADLGGHSMGGFLSLNFALNHPDKVDRLILYAPAATFHKITYKFFLKIFPAVLLKSEKLTDSAFKWFSNNKQLLTPTFRKQVNFSYKSAIPLLQLLPSKFSEEEFIGYSSKTLILIGDREVIYPTKRAMAYAKHVIPHGQFHLIKNANHSLTVENADTINELTLAFLREATI